MNNSWNAQSTLSLRAHTAPWTSARVAVAAVLGTACTVGAQELDICYDIVDLRNGFFEYTFTLSVEAGWQAGMGWGGLVFGDERSVAAGGTGRSPIDDFTLNAGQLPVGNWASLTISSGAHNGPMFEPLANLWVPLFSRQKRVWSGQSATRLEQGELLFSTLSTQGGAEAADFKVATFGGKARCLCVCNYGTSTGFGVCDLKDFLAFQSGWVRGDPLACDIDTSTGPHVCDIFDFLAFQHQIAAWPVGGCR